MSNDNENHNPEAKNQPEKVLSRPKVGPWVENAWTTKWNSQMLKCLIELNFIIFS